MNNSTFNGGVVVTIGGERAFGTSSAWRTVILAGFVAATIDLLFAFVFFGWRLGITPMRVMQSVGSGLFGPASFEGGWATAAAGFVAHYFILTVAAWFYYLASLRLTALNRHAPVAGVLYGLAIYVAMTFVIVPLSAARSRPLSLSINDVGQFLIHPVLGFSIAMIVRRASAAR